MKRGALKYECPLCLAPPGERCRRTRRGPFWYIRLRRSHWQRRVLVLEARRAWILDLEARRAAGT